MWVISGSFGNDLNTIEAGWQVPYISNTLLETTNNLPCGTITVFGITDSVPALGIAQYNY